MSNTGVRSIRANLTEWDRWSAAAAKHGTNLNAWIRSVLNESSSFMLDQVDASAERDRLLDTVRGRGPVSKYFDRR